MLYKGYVITKNKKCVEKFKDRTDLKSLDEVADLPEYAGVLADDAILIDIDDREQSETMMKIVKDRRLRCKVVCTGRGKHFLFRNTQIRRCSTRSTLAVGLTADIKAGCRASYEVLKVDGVERFVEWDVEPGTDYQEIPRWLFPVKARVDFTGMSAGDGRNQTLFNYILTLTAAGMTKDETRECIRLINQFVLADPLADGELEVILRDEAFQTPVFFTDKGQFMFDEFARYLAANHHIVKIDGQLHIYRDGVYVPDQDGIESVMIGYIPNLKKTQRREVMDYLRIISQTVQTASEDFIAFNNGVLDWKKDELLPFAPEYVLTNKIRHDYNPAAYSEAADSAFDQWSCDDPEIRALLEECIGYCFFRRNTLQKAFILVGRKANGKSTFLDCIKAILGEDNISALDLAELGERFSTAMMFGKLVNVGDDISEDFLHGNQVATFKKIVTGNELKAENKGEKPFTFKPYAKLLFSTNNMPRIQDRTGAVIRRLIIIPFDAEFKASDPGYNPRIIDDLATRESVEYMIRLGVDGLRRIMSDGSGFTYSARAQREIRRYEEENDPLIGFLEEYPPDQLVHEQVADAYRMYTVYCADNKMQPMAQKSFSAELRKRFGMASVTKRINGKLCRIYEFE